MASMEFDIWEIVACFGVIFTSAQLVPQVIKSLKTRHVRDLSLGLSVIVGLSALCWFAYGIHLKNIALVTANGINLFGAIILFYLKVCEKPDANGDSNETT